VASKKSPVAKKTELGEEWGIFYIEERGAKDKLLKRTNVGRSRRYAEKMFRERTL